MRARLIRLLEEVEAEQDMARRQGIANKVEVFRKLGEAIRLALDSEVP